MKGRRKARRPAFETKGSGLAAVFLSREDSVLLRAAARQGGNMLICPG